MASGGTDYGGYSAEVCVNFILNFFQTFFWQMFFKAI